MRRAVGAVQACRKGPDSFVKLSIEGVSLVTVAAGVPTSWKSPVPPVSSAAASSAYSAIRWMNRYPIDDVVGLRCGEWLSKQRYALAVFNYATGGILQSQNDWLVSPFHCVQWGGLICDEQYRLVQLILGGTSVERYDKNVLELSKIP